MSVVMRAICGDQQVLGGVVALRPLLIKSDDQEI
jgi:hypothetical protein